MLQPVSIPYQAMTKMGFVEEDIKAISEVARYLESCESIGLGTSLSSLMSTLGRSRDMVAKMNGVFKRIHERNTDGDTKTA